MSYSARWEDRAACRDVDPDMMQPDHPRPSQTAAALRLCASCPVFDMCERTADDHPAYGIWAGRWRGLYEPVGVFDVIAPSELSVMLGQGMTVRAIAAQLDVTKAQVERAVDELAELVRDRSA